MIWPLLGSSEASLGLLRSVSWAAQKAPETLKNAVFELPDGSGRAAALPGPRREVLGAENHPNHGMISSRVGMIWAKSSYHPSCLATMHMVRVDPSKLHPKAPENAGAKIWTSILASTLAFLYLRTCCPGSLRARMTRFSAESSLRAIRPDFDPHVNFMPHITSSFQFFLNGIVPAHVVQIGASLATLARIPQPRVHQRHTIRKR